MNSFYSKSQRRVLTPGIVRPGRDYVHYWHFTTGYPRWSFTELDERDAKNA